MTTPEQRGEIYSPGDGNHTPQQPSELAATVREALGEPADEWVTEDGVRYIGTTQIQRNSRLKVARASLDLLLAAYEEKELAYRGACIEAEAAEREVERLRKERDLANEKMRGHRESIRRRKHNAAEQEELIQSLRAALGSESESPCDECDGKGQARDHS